MKSILKGTAVPKSNKAKRNRRPQTKKYRRHGVENAEYTFWMQELRRSSATTPVPAGNSDKEPKHRGLRGKNWMTDAE